MPGLHFLNRRRMTSLLTLTMLATSGLMTPGWAQRSGEQLERSMSEIGSPFAAFLETSEGFSHKSLMEAIAKFSDDGSGKLVAFSQDSSRKLLTACTLQHTDVKAQISGYVARVTVTQKFHNSNSQKVEAFYSFPLPDSGAVDAMTMRIGNRVVEGNIKRREEAERIYQDAAAAGYTASLLNQERPNIFTQSVANIEPGKDVEVTIHYTQLLPFENGEFAFIFPTVVGPRFNPNGSGGPESTRANTAPVSFLGSSETTRTGHDLSMSVNFDSGTPVKSIHSLLHEVNINQPDSLHAGVVLKNKNTIPNKDFVLTWKPGGNGIKTEMLTHKQGKDGYLTMMLLPPNKVQPQEAAPREMIFLLDCSGSMEGQPIEKSKETMHYVLDRMNPADTFQILAFSDDYKPLFLKPQPVTGETKKKAHEFISSLSANGGTYMKEPIEAACAMPADKNRLRIVTFMTDGYVGNDFEVVDLVKRLRGNSRWFPFGIGSSVNHFLINQMAVEGGGEAEDVYLETPGKVMAEHFYSRISAPVLTDVKLQFEGVEVSDVYPKAASDVWSNHPLYFNARYRKGGRGKAILTGFLRGQPYRQAVDLTLPDTNPNNASIAQVWAHEKINDLMSQDWMGMQNGTFDAKRKEEIVNIALAHHIMTQYTSFVAVDVSHKTEGESKKDVISPEEVEGTKGQGSFSLDQLTLPRIELPKVDLQAMSSVSLAGPSTAMVNWLLASARDANLFSGGADPSPLDAISGNLNRLNVETSVSPGGNFTGSMTSGSSGANGVNATGYQSMNSPVASASSPSYQMQGGSASQWSNSNSGPALQGATFGTIGPMGADATVIQGINTAGTVRVNNLANVEALLLMFANVLDVITYAVTFFLLWRGIGKMRRQERGSRDIVLGIAWLGLSYLIPVLPVILIPIAMFVLSLRAIGSGLRWLFLPKQKPSSANAEPDTDETDPTPEPERTLVG